MVAEYLIAEMLERQPGDVQDLLLRTSLLDRVDGELADLLRPPWVGTDPAGPRGRERVRGVAGPGADLVPLSPAIRDLLRLELRRTLPEELPALHRRAAQWLLEHGQVTDAIRHTQAAGDWPDAARLLADIGSA